MTAGQTIMHQIPEDKHQWDIVQLSVISWQLQYWRTTIQTHKNEATGSHIRTTCKLLAHKPYYLHITKHNLCYYDKTCTANHP